MKTGTAPTAPQKHIDSLSCLIFHGYAGTFEQPLDPSDPVFSQLQYVSALAPYERAEFLELAQSHHVLVRALAVLNKVAQAARNEDIANWSAAALTAERGRANNAAAKLESACHELEVQGCKVAVIKSLDHWPDIGSDLDLYTIGEAEKVISVMHTAFNARPVARSWGDRLANKWNFSVPGLPELIEIHVRYLGQTGEHTKMARRVIERRIPRAVGGRSFFVAAPEEQIVISTLQRMYRHFYFRLCDMADVAALLQAKSVDFAELRKAAARGGIWPGVATFLFLIARFADSYGAAAPLPDEIIEDTCSRDIRVYFENGFLRVPKLPAAGLYGAQLLTAGRSGDLRAVCRLPLLPPLAVSALVAQRLTGNDKGIW
ncbi:MAG TPA: hypothetical protein VEF05_06065 [Terriglobales bacterium]|nr:hypothetical protein [Terriglobales bacterium]